MDSDIIPRVPLEALKQELTDEKRLRNCTRGGNIIYAVTWQDSPNVVRELGRLREISFRAAGGGTGSELDLDEFDTSPSPYHQLVVWSPEKEEILGGYRYKLGSEVELDDEGQPRLSTSHMFRFSPTFLRDYLPYTIELGRSFVVRDPQSPRKSLYALDNLWDGLGALIASTPSCRYMFGKFTMYPRYDRLSRDMILYFLSLYFHDDDHLVETKNPLALEHKAEEFSYMFCGNDFFRDYKALSAAIRKRGYVIPPLVNTYMTLSLTSRIFGTAINDEFGNVEETGILVTVSDINQATRLRYIDSFTKTEK